jgi:hypothetical protein
VFAKNYATSEKLQHIQLRKFAVFHTSRGISSLQSTNKTEFGWGFSLVHLTWNDPFMNMWRHLKKNTHFTGIALQPLLNN